ncbi:hypothetical protein KC323_g1746 [Hortaea werneckii]|nr:hypothetical protein KC323_g1746 [Hortaea werneckii]
MAFNFNWSPLIADTDRVREMLTSALNKSPKPPIIVDELIVSELNLGSSPPDLEILEIGDLAEDRFRGIFKMSYTGDAYLTLKTRVQANPLNTYLSTKPKFTRPDAVAASSGLTIPLQITLSDIRLSGFVILVFSKMKGITLVFRNDPLESLKVSSTFDSIPFVRDYLQRTIENQLRILFMEDLPAIIHRLSLRLFNPEYQTAESQAPRKQVAEQKNKMSADPFASPSQRASEGIPLGEDTDYGLNETNELYESSSQKNLLRLAALTESQRTLSLFTPGIRDTVYRAWASAADRDLANGANTPMHRPTTLSRIQSTLGTQSGVSSSAPSQTSETASQGTHPGLQPSPSIYSLGSRGSRPRGQRKKKHRIVNLRKNRDADATDAGSDAVSVSSGYTESASQSASRSASIPGTEPSSLPSSQVAREGEITTPHGSPQKKKVGFEKDTVKREEGEATIRGRPPVTPHAPMPWDDDNRADETPRASSFLPEKSRDEKTKPQRQQLPRMQTLPSRPAPHAYQGSRPASAVRSEKGGHISRSSSEVSLRNLAPSAFSPDSANNGGILEHAWMVKMATEIAKRVADEKARQGAWSPQEEHDEAPPAYVS